MKQLAKRGEHQTTSRREKIESWRIHLSLVLFLWLSLEIKNPKIMSKRGGRTIHESLIPPNHNKSQKISKNLKES